MSVPSLHRESTEYLIHGKQTFNTTQQHTRKTFFPRNRLPQVVQLYTYKFTHGTNWLTAEAPVGVAEEGRGGR